LTLQANGNVLIGKNINNAIQSVKLGVYAGNNPVPSANTSIFVSSGAVYGVTDGSTDGGTAQYAAGVVGDVTNATFTLGRFGVLGIAGSAANGISTNLYGVFSIGRVGGTGAFIALSDENIKQKIKAEENIMDKLMQLQPMTYEFKQKDYNNLALDNGLQHGIMAQNLEKVFPEMVVDVNPPTPVDAKTGKAYNPLQLKGIKPLQLIAVLVKAIQEQQAMIETQNKKIEALQNAAKTSNANAKGYTLAQNVPNPFASSTTIQYTLPQNTGNALLAVFDLNGKMLLQYNLAKSSNSIIINGNTLVPGMYIYSLIVNGNEVVSKKMVLTK
jgi:hypothetical protein